MLVIKRSAGVTPDVNLREHISCIPLPSVNKAAHSGIETQRGCHHKSKTGVSVAPQKGLKSSKNFKKRQQEQQQIGRDIIQVTFGKFVTSLVQKLKI